jgi:transmembrane 9 superfamily protein 3
MTYSVKWVPTTSKFENRFHVYLDTNFFEHQIHWFSIFNSFMMVIFLCGLVALILMRTLKNDYQKYSNEADDLDLDRVVDESGWKQVHGDVFRAPPYLMLFCAVVGAGAHLALLLVCVLGLAVASSLYITRGATLTTALICYALTSFAGGYTSASLFKRHGGERWKSLMAVVALLFPTVVFSLVLSLNTVAVLYASSAAIPIGTMLAVFALWLFVSLPLTVGGTLLGINIFCHS